MNMLPYKKIRGSIALILCLSCVTITQPASAQVPLPISWVSGARNTLGRSEAQGVGIGDRLYVMGGFYNSNYEVTRRCEVYQATTDSWSPMADMPEGITHSGTAEDGVNLYFAGGYVGQHPGPITDHVWRYHIPTNTWNAFVPLPAARGAGMVVRLGRELHFFGGAVRIGDVVQRDAPEHWALNLDAAAPTWILRAPMPIATNHLGGVALNGKLYAMGGQLLGDESFGNQSTLFEYDPATNAWTARANMPRAVGHITNSVFTLNNRIVVVGGRLNGAILSAHMMEYNPGTNSWRDLTPLPTGLLSPVAAVVAGRLVVNGGDDGTSPAITTTWRSGAVLATRAAQYNPARLELWPNPVVGQTVQLQLDTPLAGPCKVQIADALGRVRQTLMLTKSRGAIIHPVALGLQSGVYTVLVEQQEYYAVRKLVVP
ncbi:Por secretion system C-terminal sorting domain-containing protein [Hymenobacter daecheongensis DSM 21074]|uniref:Por secretion system C-terminal sorting domain-containing protein n=1 Tax=Hymenobacter daecheongensis DSM 21074 TaxID=1121955 RepID=A0A1M6GNM9_9BACT|nr:T9SS C-terminal target domain-containing protein [Hymenobacter daecheongensis]SHJ11502.1 Por secretion system C-terminal sorting domain-containing protein [Hymenobacter daecheongensis DSM 21074]